MFDKRKDNTRETIPPREPMRTVLEQERSPVPAEQRAAQKAVIGPTIVVKGELSGDEDTVIAGEFEGNIDLPNHVLTVVRSGQVRADIKANTVEIQGEVQGDVDGIEKVLIAKTGRMQGNITSPRVILDDGAIFKGRIDMEPAPPPAKPAPQAKPAAPKPTPDSAAPRPATASKQVAQPVQRSGSST